MLIWVSPGNTSPLRYTFAQTSFHFLVEGEHDTYQTFVFVLRADAKNPGFTKEEEEEVKQLLEQELFQVEEVLFLASGKSEGCGGYDRTKLHAKLSRNILALNQKIYRLRIKCDIRNRQRKSEF